MIEIIFILYTTFLNRARGSKFYEQINSTVITRIVCGMMLAIFCMALSGDMTTLPIVLIGYMLWCSFGWGKYFSAMHGNDDPKETEVKWIDWIGYKLIPSGKNKLRGVVCMGIRGMFLYPMFIALGAPFIGLLCILQGVPYYLSGIAGGSIREAEYLWGACMGLMLLGAI